MIVSNTTPLSCLLKISKADLLHQLYGVVTIPPEVATELDRAGSCHAAWRQQLGFLRVAEPVKDDPLLALLSEEVDSGEAAAIATASRNQARLLIIDDMAGRRLAQRLKLTITGTVGVVLAAAERGLVDEPFVVLDELRNRGGLWLTDALIAEIQAKWRPPG